MTAPKKLFLIASLLILFPATVMANGATKFTFEDVSYPDGTVGEIEASSKDNKKSDYTTCSYYSDDYGTYLGYYEEAGVAFAEDEADELKAFCLAHFDEREAHK